MPQYGITGRMSLAPSMRTSSVRPRARPPSAAITLAPAPSVAERVDDQAEPAEEQDLRQRLAVGRPAGELLGQGEREDEGRQRGPPRPGEPGGQAAEGQHRARAENRAPSPPPRSRRRSRTPPARIIGSPAMNCGTTVFADLVVGEAGEREPVMGAAERRACPAGSAVSRAGRSSSRTGCRTPGRGSR